LMAKRPEDRFQSPAELVSALATFLEAQGDASGTVLLPHDESRHQDSLWASLTDEDANQTRDVKPITVVIRKEKATNGRDPHPGGASTDQTLVLARSRRKLYTAGAGAAALVLGAAIAGWALFARANRTPPDEPLQASKQDAGTARSGPAPIQPKTNIKQAPNPNETPKVAEPAPPPPAKPGRDVPRTLREVKRFDGHEGLVTSVAQSADGRWAISCGEDKSLRLWELGSGTARDTMLLQDGPARAIGIRSDGGQVYAAMSDHILTWEPRMRRTQKYPNKGEYLSPDG